MLYAWLNLDYFFVIKEEEYEEWRTIFFFIEHFSFVRNNFSANYGHPKGRGEAKMDKCGSRPKWTHVDWGGGGSKITILRTSFMRP